MSLQHLVAEAVALGGGNLCAAGHAWESEGGRTCPKYEGAGCSQTVYVCTRCGAHDYGDKGGPAHKECFIECGRDFTDEIAEDAECDAEATAKNVDAAIIHESNEAQMNAKAGSGTPVKCRACGWRGCEDELWADDGGNEQCPSCLTAGLIEDAEDGE